MDDLEVVDHDLSVQIQQDNAPAHVAATTRAEFERLGLITMKGWPPSSPDLSPIEPVWGTLKRAVFSRKPRPYKQADVSLAAVEEWANIDQQIITDFIESMPRRVNAVIAANGGSTHY